MAFIFSKSAVKHWFDRRYRLFNWEDTSEWKIDSDPHRWPARTSYYFGPGEIISSLCFEPSVLIFTSSIIEDLDFLTYRHSPLESHDILYFCSPEHSHCWGWNSWFLSSHLLSTSRPQRANIRALSSEQRAWSCNPHMSKRISWALGMGS